jgi:predicted PurR-regulated permease PerM
VIAAALHPIYRRVAALLGGRAALAAILVTALAFVVMLGPIALLASSLIGTGEWLAAQAAAGTLKLPQLPAAIGELPLVGKAIATNWNLAADNIEAFLGRYSTLLLGVGERAVGPAVHVGRGVIAFFASVALAGLLLGPGPRLVAGLREIAARLIGGRGGDFVDLAGATIRNVAKGVIGVAAIQALLVGLGLIYFGVPAAGVLTIAVLMLAIVQLGAFPIVLPALAWIWYESATGTALLATAWLMAAAASDLVLKPLLLGHAATTPTLVLFLGVIGGTISFGLIGLFLGPIVLALAYEMARAELAKPRPGGIE